MELNATVRVSALKRRGLLRSMLVVGAGAGAITLSAIAGCSASGDGKDGPGFANGGGTAAGPGSGSGGFSAVGNSGGGGGFINTDSGGPGLLEDGQACASESHRAEQSPLDLYLMVDKSGSMTVEDPRRWPDVINAIKGFVNQTPQTDGMGVGLAFFPMPEGGNNNITTCAAKCSDCACVQACGCQGCLCSFGVCQCPQANSCAVADYQRPTVPIGILPQAAGGIAAALDAQTPFGGTPTLPALQGALEHAKFWATSNPGHKVVVVLATDGKPTECSSTVQNVAQVAAAAANGSPRINTFVIGVGPQLQDLNQIAAAGGTGQAFIVNGGGAQQQFTDALNKIRGASLDCEFLLPQPQNGAQLDYSKVNVQFTPPNGGAQIVKQVRNQAECGPAGGGWYYDNPQNPTRIIACPQSCSGFNAQFGGQVDVLLGCKTITATPR